MSKRISHDELLAEALAALSDALSIARTFHDDLAIYLIEMAMLQMEGKGTEESTLEPDANLDSVVECFRRL